MLLLKELEKEFKHEKNMMMSAWGDVHSKDIASSSSALVHQHHSPSN